MKKSLNILDSISVASPCGEDWNQMRGSDEARFCSHCQKDVHDLSAITRKQAKKLIAASNGGLCVRYVPRPDGKIQTANPKLHKIAGRTARLAAGVFGATMAISNAAYAQGGISISRDDSPPQSLTLIPSDNQNRSSADQNNKENQTKTKTDGSSGAIFGTVTDPNGAVVPNAAVMLTNTKNNEQRATVTNDEGVYRFDNLAFETYKIEATSPGFATSVIENVTAKTDGETQVDVLLNIGAIQGDISIISFTEPLAQAVFEQNIAEIKRLISHGANVNAKDESDGTTALHVAVENGNLETVQLLLDYGAKVNHKNRSGRTPLMQIDEDANSALVQKLLDYNAKMNVVDGEGDTALMSAAVLGKSKIVRLLIAHGAKIDQQNKLGETALMKAAKALKAKTVRALLEAGANPNVRDKDNDSAWQYSDDKAIEQLLLTFGIILDEQEASEYQPNENQPQ